MKMSALLEAIDRERRLRISSRQLDEVYREQLEARNPFKVGGKYTSNNSGVEFTVHYTYTAEDHYLAEGYDKNGEYRESFIMFTDMED